MDFQKVDIGKGQFSPVQIDLVKLIENRIPMFESMAKSKDIEFTFTTNQTKYVAAVDEVMIEKIIDNLISNAINYSLQKGKVSINLTCNESKWILEVKDQGIGISRKAQGHLFKEFYRGENAINSKTIGSGIGLLLVKNYVSRHGGQVSCTSEVDVGSVFKITIPRKMSAEPNQSNILTRNATLSEINHEFTGQAITTMETGLQKEMRILIVEDNDELRNFILKAIQSEFEVLTANDGSKGWEILQKQMPDLVISDIMMPNMSGFELCQLMKSTYETSHIPIILLTALSDKANQLHGLGLGADDYLTKPFDVALLLQKIKTIIQNRNAIREKALKLININNSQPILSNQLNDQFVKKMLEVIRLNMANADFNKNNFAVEMNVSSSLLYKKVKLLTDQSPTDFIKTVRLDYALKLLQSRKYTITEVSELCGFNSIGYFSTVFKKYYGKSPTEIG
jgi:DNA-binding response OmpR family regulator/anti-sigma regulatory factor (Ser/Thr protein kinase)